MPSLRAGSSALEIASRRSRKWHDSSGGALPRAPAVRGDGGAGPPRPDDPPVTSHVPTSLSRRRAICLVVAACALSAQGCTSWGQYWRNHLKVGPAYLRPAAPVEHDWIDADDPQVRSASDVETQWWRQFNDPVLDQLVLQAYEQNFTLREAGFRVLAV